MSKAKKMVLISPEVLQRLNNPIKDNTLNNLENDMSNILQSNDLEDRTKWAQYQQLLQRRQHFHDQLRQPAEIPIIETPDKTNNNESLQEEILRTLPKGLRTKGELLFKRLCTNDVITWDDFGRVSINKTAIPGSNITDLVCDVIRSKKTGATGLKQFLEGLETINIPKTLIGNCRRIVSCQTPPQETVATPTTAQSPSRPVFPTMTQNRRRSTPLSTRPISRLTKWSHSRLH